MTAPVLQAPPLTETQTVTAGSALLAAVYSDTFPWPGTGSAMIRNYAEWLRDDLEAYEDFLAQPPRRHPASEFPELARWWPDDALGQAVAKVTEDIGKGTGALAEVVRRFCGDDVADSVLAAAAQAGRQEGGTK